VSSVPIPAAPGLSTGDRRAHQRRRLDQLAYIGFGPNSGGVLLDISEGGLRCQIVGPIIEGELCRLKFVLPGEKSAIETQGQVVWSNTSKQGGGVRLLSVDAELQQQLQQWIANDPPCPSSKRPAPISIRTKTEAVAQPPVGHVSANAGGVLQLPARQIHLQPEHSPPATTPQPSAPPEARSRAPLRTASGEPQNRRALAIAVIVGAVLLGLIALAFSGFDPWRVSEISQGGVRPEVSAPSTVAPKVPVKEAESQPRAHTDAQQEITQTGPGSDAADHSARTANQPARSELSSPAPASAERAAPRPPATPAANRPPLAMRLSQPRLNSPARPGVAAPAPEVNAATIVPPPTPLMDLQSLGSDLPEIPKPAQPATGTNYQSAVLVSRVEPIYSTYARDAHLQGTVQISFTIGSDGAPRSLARVSGNSTLAEMAFDAVRRWRYQPALLNGQPVEAQTVASFNFQLRP